ncbi:hypothetical protein PFISCL1PPCAC_9608, partial [Pristionchus fissidentatus]
MTRRLRCSSGSGYAHVLLVVLERLNGEERVDLLAGENGGTVVRVLDHKELLPSLADSHSENLLEGRVRFLLDTRLVSLALLLGGASALKLGDEIGTGGVDGVLPRRLVERETLPLYEVFDASVLVGSLVEDLLDGELVTVIVAHRSLVLLVRRHDRLT